MAGQGKLWGTRCPNERGAVAVEFALVLPLLGMLLFGIVSFGLAFSDRIALVNTVREGARFGASASNDSLWAPAVVDRTTQLYSNADSPLTTSQVCALLWLQPESGAATIQQKSSDECAAGTAPAGSVPDPPA